MRGSACDAFAPALDLAMFVGRFCRYFAGEDGLGKSTALPWGVTLTADAGTAHPTPLYDGLVNLIWCGVLIALRDHRAMQNGNLLKFGVAGYAVFRFFVEFLRTKRVLAWGLIPHQSVCLEVLATLGAYYGLRRRVASAAAVA